MNPIRNNFSQITGPLSKASPVSNGTRIGVFDSGLGGLWILKHLREAMPEYDYVFMGDQKNVPYGKKSVSELLIITKKALDFFYEQQDCGAVLLACNTVSSAIYAQLRAWVEEKYPGRLIFGIVKPTVESLQGVPNLAAFATLRTIESNVYQEELSAEGIALPELCTLIESGQDVLPYLSLFSDQIPNNIKNGALLCTHYGIVLDEFKKSFPGITNWYRQEEIIPAYMKSHFERYPEKLPKLSKNGTADFFVTEKNIVFDDFFRKWFSGDSLPQVVEV